MALIVWSRFRMAYPAGILTTPLNSPGPIPFKASRNSGRKPVGSMVPRKPPWSALGSIDFSTASAAKSSPFFKRSTICWAPLRVSTTMMRSGILAVGSVCTADAEDPAKSALPGKAIALPKASAPLEKSDRLVSLFEVVGDIGKSLNATLLGA